METGKDRGGANGNGAGPMSRRLLRFQPVVWVFSVQVLLYTTGCAPEFSTFQITDHRPGEPVERYHEEFDEGYYDLDPDGNVDVVLRRVSSSTPDRGRKITQIIHLRSHWRSIPGRTVADETQLNGTVRYMIRLGRAAAMFEGAGSLFYHETDTEDVIEGSLDHALLSPTRRLAAAPEVFQHAELTGHFRAEYNPRFVTRIIHEMERTFGTME
jgi:hypothetical protein